MLEGIVDMTTEYNSNKDMVQLKPHGMPMKLVKKFGINPLTPGTENAHILEIQWGNECIEEDIERRD